MLVHFDLLPTSMRFNAPAYACMVTENGIQYSHGFAETYGPILNPALVVSNWGNDLVEVAIDDKAIKPGKNLRVGYEPTPAGTSLILWFQFESKESVNVSLSKGGK